MKQPTEYELALAKICRLRAQAERLEANAVYVQGSPYDEDEKAMWADYHNSLADDNERTADDFEGK